MKYKSNNTESLTSEMLVKFVGLFVATTFKNHNNKDNNADHSDISETDTAECKFIKR